MAQIDKRKLAPKFPIENDPSKSKHKHRKIESKSAVAFESKKRTAEKEMSTIFIAVQCFQCCTMQVAISFRLSLFLFSFSVSLSNWCNGGGFDLGEAAEEEWE